MYYVYGVEYEACSYYGSENKCWASTYYSYNCTDADKVFLDDIFPDGCKLLVGNNNRDVGT